MPDGLQDQGNELKRVLKRFGAKLEKLQSYELCDEYHLHIASTWHFDRRCVKFIMDALMEKTLKVAGESGRVFDRVFLSADEAMCDFDLRAGKYRYICRRNITSQEEDSIIIPPG